MCYLYNEICFFHSVADILIKDGNPIEVNDKLITEKKEENWLQD
jgi:hypothetical protein